MDAITQVLEDWERAKDQGMTAHVVFFTFEWHLTYSHPLHPPPQTR